MPNKPTTLRESTTIQTIKEAEEKGIRVEHGN